MNMSKSSRNHHAGPPLGIMAIVHALLFIAGLYFVASFPEHLTVPPSAVPPSFPGLRELDPHQVLWCAFLQFIAAIPLALYTATMVSRLYFLGVRSAGATIALVGGLLTVCNLALSSLILWVISYPGMAQEPGALRALYYLVFAIGGVGFSVPMAIFILGVSIPALATKLLPKWLVIFGYVLASMGILSASSVVVPEALLLVPLTRFPGFIWLIAVGFLLPRARNSAPLEETVRE
jgi:hypothetical protein